MESVTGEVRYEVRVTCPCCKRLLDLTAYPYDDEQSDFSPYGEDVLGMAVFGSKSVPAQWDNLDLEYQCFKCLEKFKVAGLEV